MTNWDEDSLTMAVAAARDCLGPAEDRSHIRNLWLASSTLPFAERLNAGVVCEALTLQSEVHAIDLGGTPRAALAAMAQALGQVRVDAGAALVLAADNRKTRAASSQELAYGDGAAAICIGTEGVIAEHLGNAAITVDFVDHFRSAGEEYDYHWEERWVRDEGISKLVPEAIRAALAEAGVDASAVDRLIVPSTFTGVDRDIARRCGIRAEAVVDSLAGRVGETGSAHALLLLSHALETAPPGQVILVAQFGSGAHAMVFRTTDRVQQVLPVKGVSGWMAAGVEEHSYTKFLSFKEQLRLERGMRGEQDKKTALSTAFRHRSALLGLIAGRCEVTGTVHFPPSRISYDQGRPLQDTQRPYKLADRKGRVLSWSEESLSFHRAPPHQYGQVDFDGGGRILMEFTDVAPGDITSDTEVEMVFRIKDIDEVRGFRRYFWKATPTRR
jgi:3-hydroxy-3-methylglutaryl CoA synthase